jgi:hypothetical protein
MNSDDPLKETPAPFIPGGPLYQMLLRAKLTTPTVGLLHRRLAVFVLLAWVPLAVLTAMTGNFLGGAGVPFLLDLDVHVKFLLSVPLLIMAEGVVRGRVQIFVQWFLDGGLVVAEDQPRFEAIVRGSWRVRNSAPVEIVLIVLAFTAGHWLWREQVALSVATWFATPVNGAMHYTAAGWWYAFFSLPLTRFILLRWLFRLVLWYIFLFRVSRLPLRLNALHPDRAGGLGFLGNSIQAFVPLLLAQTVMLAGLIGNQIWHQGTKLPDYKFMIAGVIAGLMLLILLPLGFFLSRMVQAKRQGLRQYGLLASRYTNEFRRKWVEGTGSSGQELLGTGDIQSLADLGNSYEVVRQMRMLPFDPHVLVRVAIVLAVPLLPLTLTMFSLEEVVSQAIKIIL